MRGAQSHKAEGCCTFNSRGGPTRGSSVMFHQKVIAPDRIAEGPLRNVMDEHEALKATCLVACSDVIDEQEALKAKESVARRSFAAVQGTVYTWTACDFAQETASLPRSQRCGACTRRAHFFPSRCCSCNDQCLHAIPGVASPRPPDRRFGLLSTISKSR
eukprot:TRINITY_DN10357_c0_g8_i1.p1 TRINITY_DN10357_c0_g8~~TRINITY_DN10357_c0_g8_i1.p1  ORF type:complete len:160 (+),score=3.10 TRINITY_DN10357_c0_g8_i1:328-807(+)